MDHSWLDNVLQPFPVTRGALKATLDEVHKTMMDAGRDRNFELARSQEEVWKKLQGMQEHIVFETMQENLVFLNEKIDLHVEQRQWTQAESLHRVVLKIQQEQLDEDDSNNTGPDDNPVSTNNFQNDDEAPTVKKRVSHRNQEEDEESNKRPCVRDCLTVFRANPLVWVDNSNRVHAFQPPPDFEREEETLLDAVKHCPPGRKIDIHIEGATTFGLAAFLAASDKRVLHYSGHGHSSYLPMENWGAMQCLGVKELKEFVAAGPRNVQLVFVSACYSRAAGEAFVAAGVPHVVCCQQEVNDQAAIEFTRNFYLQLSCEQHLRQAFNMAKAATKVAKLEQDDKFLLLPEKKEDDPYHDVQVFFTTESASYQPPQPSNGNMLPAPPSVFLGRQIPMYNVLQYLKQSRLIRIEGEPGTGKSSVGKAVCAYIKERKGAFLLEDIFWLPLIAHNEVSDNNPTLEALHEVIGIIKNDDVPADDKELRLCNNKVASLLHERRTLLFVDGRTMYSDRSRVKLRLFLDALFVGTIRVSVVLVCPSGHPVGSRIIPFRTKVGVGPLDMRSSVLLFGSRCPFVAQGLCPGVRTPGELAKLLVPESHKDATSINKSMSKRCEEIFSRIGEGRPEWICSAAREMTASGYEDLVKIGMRKEFRRGKYDTRVTLEQEWKRAADSFKLAWEEGDYGQAQQLKTALEELEQLRDTLPTLEELRLKERDLSVRLDEEASLRHFDKANELKKRLTAHRAKIKREEEALSNVSNGGDEDDVNAQVQSQHSVSLDNIVSGLASGKMSVADTPSSNARPGALSPTSSNHRSFTVSPRTAGSFEGASFMLSIVHMSVLDLNFANPNSAIVCASNESCRAIPSFGTTVSWAMAQAGGDEYQRDAAKLAIVEENDWGPVRCPTGEARIIGPSESRCYGELNVSYVIFAVGPSYSKEDGQDSLNQKDGLLRSAYRSSLELAKEKCLESVSFSLLSAGRRAGSNLERPLRIAVEVIADFEGYEELQKVQLCAFKKREADLLKDIARELGLAQATTS